MVRLDRRAFYSADKPFEGLGATCDMRLDACHQEPIHAPGAVQPHGILIVADAVTLRVTHVSENFARSTGLPSRSVLGSLLTDVIGESAAAEVLTALTCERYSAANVMTLDLAFKRDGRRNVAAHAHAGCIFLEVESASPVNQYSHVASKVQAIIAGLRPITSVMDLCARTTTSLRAFTGYDRVMVYRFDPDGNGEVIAEDKRSDLEPYLHLRYPASDIPNQARQLYLMQRIRVIADVGYKPVQILMAAGAHEEPLDMSFCGLRSVSPIHIEYLKNMGVGATLVVSLIQDDVLWGMIVCHHMTPHIVNSDVRSLCDLLGQLVMLLIGRATEHEALELHVERNRTLELLKHEVSRASSVKTGLAAMSAELIKLVAASGAVLRLNGQIHLFGSTPSFEQTKAVLSDLEILAADDVLATDCLGKLLPHLASLAASASGVLFLPLRNNSGDAVAWFRPEVSRTVEWGGNPRKPVDFDPNRGGVAPRKSFAAWREILKGTSAAWTKAEVLAAQDLKRVITHGMLRHAEAALLRLSTVDPLTGLANRRGLEEALENWSRAPINTPAALLFVDLDRFKTVNDSLGHAAGDELLVQVAQRLEQTAPTGWLVARLGGDEFVAFVTGSVAFEARAVAAGILQSLHAPFEVFGRAHRASGSIGIAHAKQPGSNLLREADAAMYAAKRQGSRCAVVFDETLHEKALKDLQIEQDLHIALQRKEFVLHYQPIIGLAESPCKSFEALVRWRHPDHGLIAPSSFIPLAEDTGLIGALGIQVMEMAIRQIALWSEKDLQISINVSPRQLTSEEFVTSLKAALCDANVAASSVIIEVTESALMDEQAVEQLHLIRQTGCRIAVDDFGTGYSSLTYLRHLPIDIIKIDRSFVSPLGEDPKADCFFTALVSLAHTLGLKVIAEGVETEQQLAVVSRSGCDKVQGYFYARPLPPEDLIFYWNS